MADIEEKIQRLERAEKEGVDHFEIRNTYHGSPATLQFYPNAMESYQLKNQPESIQILIRASVVCLIDAYKIELTKLQKEFDTL